MKKIKPINLAIILAGAIVTLAAILIFSISVTSSCVRSNKLKKKQITSIDQIPSCNYNNYTNQNGNEDGEYFVFIYSKGETFEDDYESIVIEYANYCLLDNTAKPIYVLDYLAGTNYKIVDDLSGTITLGRSIPGLLLIDGGSIGTQYLSFAKMNNALTKAMNKQ